MAYISEQILNGLGIGYSIVGIALVMPACFIFRQYLRFLDHLQVFYLFYLALGNSSVMFSKYLDISWVEFNQNIYVVCTNGDLVCTSGFPLSFTTCLVAFLLIMRLVVLIQQCRKDQFRYQPVYAFFKGFFRWTYLPLSYYSTYFIIASAQGTKNSLAQAIVIFCYCVIFPFLQLIAYKCIQKQQDQIWIKWIQFFGYLRLLLFGILVASAQLMTNQSPYYFIYALYIIYTFIFGWKSLFVYPIVGRIFFIIGQILVICVSFFFLFKISILIDFHLDFIFITVIFAFDIGQYIAKAIYFVRYGVPKEISGRKVLHEESHESEGDSKKKQTIDVQYFQQGNKKKDDTHDDLIPTVTGNLSKQNLKLKKR